MYPYCIVFSARRFWNGRWKKKKNRFHQVPVWPVVRDRVSSNFWNRDGWTCIVGIYYSLYTCTYVSTGTANTSAIIHRDGSLSPCRTVVFIVRCTPLTIRAHVARFRVQYTYAKSVFNRFLGVDAIPFCLPRAQNATRTFHRNKTTPRPKLLVLLVLADNPSEIQANLPVSFQTRISSFTESIVV